MKLLTKKETDRFYSIYLTDKTFNETVNLMLMDAKIVKSLLKQAKRIKSKLI